MDDLGLRIREERIGQGLSQRNLAQKAEISNTYLSDIERGRTAPSLRTLKKLAEALTLEIKELF